MNKIDQIKAEIERRKNELEKDKYINIDAQACRTSELTYLERFINSLPEEKPSEDLEKAVDGYVGFPYELGEDITTTIRRNAFIAGAKWQKEQKPAEWSDADDAALGFLHELISFGYTRNFFDAQTAADMRKWVNTKLQPIRPAWKACKEQVIGIIEGRIAEILGDAQPAPILRMELDDIIKRIKED